MLNLTTGNEIVNKLFGIISKAQSVTLLAALAHVGSAVTIAADLHRALF
jgi:hypothetical protein